MNGLSQQEMRSVVRRMISKHVVVPQIQGFGCYAENDHVHKCYIILQSACDFTNGRHSGLVYFDVRSDPQDLSVTLNSIHGHTPSSEIFLRHKVLSIYGVPDGGEVPLSTFVIRKQEAEEQQKEQEVIRKQEQQEQQVMGKSPATMAQHVGEVVGMLQHKNEGVRRAAVHVMGKLDAATLAHHAAAVVSMLQHEDLGVRRAAMDVMGKLDAATLAQHAGAVVGMLQNEDERVRRAAMDVLAELEPATLAQHAGAVVRMLQDEGALVRWAAVEVIGKLLDAEQQENGGEPPRKRKKQE